MDYHALHVRVWSFRRHGVAWIVLLVFIWSLLPSFSIAQQPTATISELNGGVLVNGQEQRMGAMLKAGDTIETRAGASVVLTLSGGSEIYLGKNTRIAIADLTRTAKDARVSRLKLLWGRIRAKLSPGHQQAGSTFDIETPNALVGVKFSQPDVEVSYNPSTQETIGLAHTVELLAKNLLTDEDVLVPVGSSVIIVGTTIKVVAGILLISGATEAGATETATTGAGTTGTETSSTGSSGLGTGTKVALGVGAAAAAGGIAALAVSSSDGNGSSNGGNNVSFTGIFRQDTFFPGGAYKYEIYTFEQAGNVVTGTFEIIDHWVGMCDAPIAFTDSIAETLNDGRLSWSWSFKEECCALPDFCAKIEAGSYTAFLSDDGNTLTVSGPPCNGPDNCGGPGTFIRQ